MAPVSRTSNIQALLLLLCLVGQSRAFFRMLCSQPVTLVRADPITAEGRVSTHLHTVLGSNGFDFSQTYEGLRKSTCSTCMPVADKSAYWTPTLWYHAQNGSFHRVNQLGGATIYYLQRYEYPGQKLKAFPPGFRLIAGDMSLRSFNNASLAQRAVTHHCLDYGNTGAEGEWHYFPKHHCPNGVRTQVFFPSCWNGKDVDSADHREHMAYPDATDSGKCPASHPVRLVSLFYEIIWDTAVWKSMWWTPPGRDQPFVLSNGDPTGYSFHGDFANGWDQAELQKAVDTCTNESGEMKDCHTLKLRTDEEMNNCIIPPRTLDGTEGWQKRLPGCNEISQGSSKVKQMTNCGAPDTIISRKDATFLTPAANWTSLGCARDDLPQRALTVSWSSPDMTVNKCVAHCSSAGYNYAGLEWGQECWCGTKFDAGRLGQFPCNQACAGDSAQHCGAPSHLAMYHKGAGTAPTPTPNTNTTTTANRYIRPTVADHKIGESNKDGWYPVGCFKDAVNPRALRGHSFLADSKMTPKTCATSCGNLGFNYAGLEYGGQCFCGSELYGSSKIDAAQCSMKCTGDSKQKCGGKSALAVFRKSSKAKKYDHSDHFFGRRHWW
ncbi:WSC-domain-containing protein [Auriculariales sp. MPI-PUGE-AT-0066]|nr:WSC-domain-containing protein [Auriculariales sp. MPI-PUGE-AT-0066]